ncbi:MAG: hypothetical protein COW29_04700 [Rhodobacterales bacterium CG15_BIG_FIL_POST_REV_8_21_14_020_59_13]|nr:MAG: hypothetical protein COW29_04700 [Rhodobacterales bacterium CG15_BIG_FIL_POST_REV_8_21_14_020_59_13]
MVTRRTPDGFHLPVRLTPNARRDSLDGWDTDADGQAVLRVHVRAIPENGKANTALVKLLAKRLGIGKTRVNVTRGQTSRIKTVSVDCDADEADMLIAKLTEADR